MLSRRCLRFHLGIRSASRWRWSSGSAGSKKRFGGACATCMTGNTPEEQAVRQTVRCLTVQQLCNRPVETCLRVALGYEIRCQRQDEWAFLRELSHELVEGITGFCRVKHLSRLSFPMPAQQGRAKIL